METQPWIQDPIAHKMSELPPNPSMQPWTFYSTSVFLCWSAQPNTLLRDGHCSDGAGDGTLSSVVHPLSLFQIMLWLRALSPSLLGRCKQST